MDDPNVLRVITAVELAGFQQGFPAAAGIVEQGSKAMVDSLSKMGDGAKDAARAVADGLGQLGPAVDEAAKQAEGAKDVFARIFEGLKHPFEEGHWKELSEGVGEMIAHPFKTAGVAVKDLLMEMGPVGAIAVGAAAGLAELGKQAFELVNEEGAAARQTQNLAARLGTTFEETKKLSEMARIVDVDISSLSRAAFKLADALQNPSGKEGEELKKLGVTATETGPALLQVLEKLSEITDKTERMAEARKLLGRAAISMQPVIEDYQKLGEAVEALGGKLSGDAVQGLLDAREKIQEVGIAWDHLKEQVASGISPLITVTVKAASAVLTGSVWDLSGMGAKADAMERASAKKEEEADKKPPEFGASGIRVLGGKEDVIAQHAKSLQGLKEELEKTTKSEKELWAQITGPTKADSKPINQLIEQHAAAAKKITEIEAQIKAAEKAKSGQGVGERNAIAAQQIEQAKKVALLHVDIAKDAAKRMLTEHQATADQETAALVTAEDLRWGIERKAAERVNSLKAQTARAEHKPAPVGISLPELDLEHQRNLQKIKEEGIAKDERLQEQQVKNHIEDLNHELKWNQEIAAHVEKLNAELATKRIGYDTAVANASIAAATRAADFSKARVEESFKDDEIDASKRIQLLKEIEEQAYRTQLAGAVQEQKAAVKEHGTDSKQAVDAGAKVDSLTAKHNAYMAKLDEDAKHIVTLLQTTYKTGMNTVATAFNTGFDQVLNKQKSFAAAMVGSFRSMADGMIMNVARTMEQALIAAALHDALAKKSVLAAAYGAAANTFHNVTKSGIGGPFNPIIAAAEAAGVMISVMGFSSFDQGGIVPVTQMALVHGGERVLTVDQTSRFERAIGAGEAGGASGPTYNYHAAPGESPDSVTRNVQALRRAIRDGRVRLA